MLSPSPAAAMTPIEWFSLLHPVLMILFVYPVVGATIRLGILARERRLEINPLPASVGVEHADHGRWVGSGAVVAVLIALIHSFLSGTSLSSAVSFPRLALLLLVCAGTFASLLALWRVRLAALRASFALLTWAGLLALGSQPEVWRQADNPFSGAFWSSHYWSGMLLMGLLLFSMAAGPEIIASLRFRRLHVSANLLVAVLLAVQAITGSRDLLGLPLSRQGSVQGQLSAAPSLSRPASLSRASASARFGAPIS
ncbi:DUF4079 domain-containing protein [Candidatus Regnicoccus frigidus]|uniref:DUF4079 domain-containing protein n=2 Tax=Synechococcaceae TaxID=1890426 RepID=UPI0028BF4E1E|nr:DUF4079 domain-containing protein [Candidatus Regnicoccus frigidus]